MPIPSPSGKEQRSKFVSRCVSELTRKGEGNDAAQRVAICNSRFKKSKANLTQAEIDSLKAIMAGTEYGAPVKKKKKKKKKKNV